MKWPMHRLDELCGISTGKTPPRSHGEYFGGEHVWVTIADLNDGLVSSSKERVTDKAIVDANMRLVTPGTVLLSYKLTLEKLGIAGCPLYTNEAIAALTPRSGVTVMPKFVYYAMKRVDFDALCHGAVKGKCLNRDSLSNIQLPLPPLSEQRRIVEILDQADTLRKQRAEADAKADRILPPLFYRMFGDPVRNEKGWPARPMKELATFVGGGTPSRAIPGYFEGNICWATSKDMKGEVLFGTQEHITEEAIQNSATKLVPLGTLLVVVKSKILMHRLPVLLTKVPTCFGQDLKGIIPSKEVPAQYLARHLRLGQQTLLQQARGVNTEGLTLEHLSRYKVMLPPEGLMRRYAELEQQHCVIRDAMATATEEADTLYQSLLHRAFTGDLTAKWREGRTEELMEEIDQQGKASPVR